MSVTTEQQWAEWESLAIHSESHFSIDLAEAFVQAIPVLIADLREARAKLAESQALLRKLSPLMINAGYVGANADIQKALQDVRVELVKLDTPELDAVIAKKAAELEAELAEAGNGAKRFLEISTRFDEASTYDSIRILDSLDLTGDPWKPLSEIVDAAIATQENPK